MSIAQPKLKILLITLGGVGVALYMIIITFRGGNSSSIDQQKGTIPTLSYNTTPPVYPTPSVSPGLPYQILENVKQKLPYQNERFIIEYLPKNKKMYITILSSDIKNAYKEAILILRLWGIPSPEYNSSVSFTIPPPKKFR